MAAKPLSTEIIEMDLTSETQTPEEDLVRQEVAVSHEGNVEVLTYHSDLKESERKALTDFKEMLRDAIPGITLFHNVEPNLWGVSLLPGSDGSDVVFLNFLRSTEFDVVAAFKMLKKTLQWRKKFNTDNILDEQFDPELESVAILDGVDHEGRPVLYNFFSEFNREDLYQKTFATKEKRNVFVRWRIQLLERILQKLEVGGAFSYIQIHSLKNSPHRSMKELAEAVEQSDRVLLDNYPGVLAKNIFLDVPRWYCFLNAVASPFIRGRTKTKFVFSASGNNALETLLKHISVEQIPGQFCGLKVDGSDWTAASELTVKARSTKSIEIPALEVGSSISWYLTIPNWHVTYEEHFVPDEGYTLRLRGEKINSQDVPITNTFQNKEPGRVILTVENKSKKKNKRVLYRYKITRQ